MEKLKIINPRQLAFTLIFLLFLSWLAIFHFIPLIKADISTFQINTTANDGYVNGASATYLTAHDTATSAFTLGLTVAQCYSGGIYYVARGFWKFDTSSIPATATITAAGLTLAFGVYKRWKKMKKR